MWRPAASFDQHGEPHQVPDITRACRLMAFLQFRGLVWHGPLLVGGVICLVKIPDNEKRDSVLNSPAGLWLVVGF